MTYLAYYIIIGILSFCVLYTMFVVLFAVKNNYDYKTFNPLLKYPLYLLFAIGYIGDVLWNILYGSVLFLQSPLWNKDQTLTKRLNYIIRHTPYEGWRSRMARFICKYMLNIAHEGHCGER